jgi:hypothetical protein
MSKPLTRILAPALAVGLAATLGVARAQDEKAARRPEAGPDAAQKVGGVITKVEEAGEGRRGAKLTIKTSAVWADYVRDTAQLKSAETTTEEAAAKGKKSVATKGQPAAPATVVAIEVAPEAKVETRYRSADDEAGPGSPTPRAAAAEAQGKQADRAADKPKELTAADLKVGLFVEVEYRRAGDRNRAGRVVVMRPVDATPAPAAKPER